MNKTSSLLANDAVKMLCELRDGSGVGATNGWEPHAHNSGNPDPSNDQRIHDHTRRARAPALQPRLKAIMRPSYEGRIQQARGQRPRGVKSPESSGRRHHQPRDAGNLVAVTLSQVGGCRQAAS
jgi:hypothetical protein